MKAELQKEHQWLERLVGQWTYEAEAIMEPGTPPAKHTGTESVRSLDGVWVVCEGRGEVPGAGTAASIMTLGYDPARRRYVGTFVGSMVTHLWIYRGELDPAGKALTLDTEGPSFTGDGKTGSYRDVIAFTSHDRRVLTSSFLGEDGRWHEFMTAHYRRAT